MSTATIEIWLELTVGLVPWSHSMGTRAAERFLRDVRRFSPQTHTILQPFCGIGLRPLVEGRLRSCDGGIGIFGAAIKSLPG